MRKLKVTSLCLIFVFLLYSLARVDEIILPHIKMEIVAQGLEKSYIEILPDGKLTVYYGGEMIPQNIVWKIDENGNEIGYIEDEVGIIHFEIEGNKKEKRRLTLAESKEILKMVETVKNECEIGDGGMADGIVAHVYIDGIQYACWFWWERWGYNMELRPLAYYLVNLSRMKEMDYYKEHIPGDFFENT